MIFGRIVFLAIAVAVAALGVISYRTYYARYYYTAAILGVHSNDEYERRLKRSLNYDSSFGYSALMLGALESRKGNVREALDWTTLGLKTFRTLNGFGQLAGLYERLGRTSEAEELLQKIARVYPAKTDTLLRLAVMQYRRGDSAALEQSASRLLRFDFRDTNALYLLAADADRRGERKRARTLYQRIAADTASTTDTSPRLFTAPQLAQRIEALREPAP